MEYDYSPISKRGKLEWPNGARVALVFTFNLETWDLIKDSDKPYYAGGPQVQPASLPGNIPDIPNFGWREYGQRVGIWRLFELFDEMEAKASCTANAVTFQRRRAMVEACLERGWELLAHNWEQGELLTDYAFDRDREAEIIARSTEVYEQEVGRRPAGWLSSSLRSTMNTCDILKENGYRFFCDVMNDDQPYLIRTPSGPLVSTPYTNEINDFTLLSRSSYTTDQYRDILIEELNVLHEESKKGGRIMNVGLHPHVIGRAYRIRALREFIAHAKSLPGVWFATREEIADHYMTVHESHIPGQLG